MHSFAFQQTTSAGPAPRAGNPVVQPKLRIGPIDDPFEREADQAADAVMAGDRVRPLSPAAIAPQRNRAECAGEHEQKLQRKDAGLARAAIYAPAIVHEVLRSPGEPLDAATLAYFEPRFGRDFSGVRVHSSSIASLSSALIGARAYAHGQTIVFGNNQRPGLNRLTAHELAHVAQSQKAPCSNLVQRAPGDEDYRIVTDVWLVKDHKNIIRPIVVIEHGGNRQAFYKRSGDSPRPPGHGGPQGGDWAPFDGFKESEGGGGHYVKNIYHAGKFPDNPLHGYGDSNIRKAAKWLDKMDSKNALPKGTLANWKNVQIKLQEYGVAVHSPLPSNVATQRGHTGYPSNMKGVTSGEIVHGEIADKNRPTPPQSGSGGSGSPNLPAINLPPKSTSPQSSGTNNLHSDIARIMLDGQNKIARAQRFTQRLQSYLAAWGKLTQALNTLSAIHSMTSLLAHGTAMPKEQHDADLVLQDSNDAIEAADYATEDISIFALSVALEKADRLSDEKMLFGIDVILTKMRTPLADSAGALEDLADKLFGQADDLMQGMYQQFVEILMPHQEGTADNAIAFALYRSLELIHGTILSASRNYKEASATLRFWALQLEKLAGSANDLAWFAARKHALLNYRIAQAKQFRSLAPVVETTEQVRMREFMDALQNPRSFDIHH